MAFPVLRFVAAALVILSTLGARPSAAEAERVAFGSEQCGGLAWREVFFESNALLLAPALTGVLLEGGPSHAKWKGGILYDSDIRDDLMSGTRQGRLDSADTADVLLGVTLALPALDILFRLKDPDCASTMDLTSDLIESLLLTSLVEMGTKSLSARRRPDSDDAFKSFPSGHAALTGTAAGLVCSNAFRKGMWGERWFTKALPCLLTSALATTTGVYRIKADEHWASDVAVGLLVGFASGWFDLPNLAAYLHKPLGVEWLKENTRVHDARVLPMTVDGAVGLRFAVTY